MFGYATNETENLMSASISYAHKLEKKQADIRSAGTLGWLRPDAKSQLILLYHDSKPVAVDAIVLSSQHSPEVSLSDLKEGVEEIIKPVISAEWINSDTQIHISPTCNFVIGGPVALLPNLIYLIQSAGILPLLVTLVVTTWTCDRIDKVYLFKA